MERLKVWGAECTSGIVGFFCWFTPSHCDYLAKVIAVLIGLITLLFITLPKAWPNIKKTWKKIGGAF